MNSSSISDGEVHVQVNTLPPAELASWVFNEADAVYAEFGELAADQFSCDLVERISDKLPPEKDTMLSVELAKIWCGTELTETGSRRPVSRSARRRNEAALKKTLSRRVNQQHLAEGMMIDAYGQKLMSSEKLAEVLDLPVEEVMELADKLVEENPGSEGYSPGIDDDGNVFPIRAFFG